MEETETEPEEIEPTEEDAEAEEIETEPLLEDEDPFVAPVQLEIRDVVP